MASQMEWSHEFCLSCDRQIAEGGAYCSQACRLADLEKAGCNGPTTPSNLSSSASSSASSSNGFYLPPAVNFSAYKAPSTSKGFVEPSSPHRHHYQHYYANTHYSTTQSSYFSQAGHSTSSYQYQTQSQPQPRNLSPSSSRSSLASAGSQAAPGISMQAAQQLNGYVRSFDQVRDRKRRMNY